MDYLVISGGRLPTDFAAAYYRSRFWRAVIAADSGLDVCHRAGIEPDHIVGDFDSLGEGDREEKARGAEGLLEEYAQRGVPIRRYQPEKDLTDTQIAVELALSIAAAPEEQTDVWGAASESGAKPPVQIHVLGGTGSRLDHVLGNLQVMELALKRGAAMVLADPYVRVRLHGAPFQIRREEQWGRYVSLIPWAGEVEGLTLRGFKYPLENAVFSTAQSLGISNEITGEAGEVSFTKGLLLAVESADQPVGKF